MVRTVASIRSWIDRESSACLVVGPPGAGKSHLLNSAAQEVAEPLVMPPADGSDCSHFIKAVQSGWSRRVVADDLDKFAKGLREDVIKLAAASRHQMLTSMTELSSRMLGLFRSKYSNVEVVSLEDLASRREDIRDFIGRWVAVNGIASEEKAVSECTDFCCASGLPRGFWTVEAFLIQLAESGWGFQGPLSAAAAASAYREAISPPPTKPTILVEGYTDRIYLEWLLQGLPSPPEIEVRDCGGASVVAEQAIALRNQGRSCVAVLDSDNIGKRLRKQLVEFRHPVVSVPIDAVNLPESAYDHVQQIAEIEDLLPVATIEQFLTLAKRQPELEIRTPTGVRYVIAESDKRELASWVAEEVDREAVPQLAALLAEALAQLGVGA
ncbi:hypothetical protein ACFL2Q_03745 [Thermodesulfobacteriota bacterium]